MEMEAMVGAASVGEAKVKLLLFIVLGAGY